MKNQNMHGVLLALVGGYLLYSAGHLLDNLLSGINDMPRAACIAAIAVFATGGIGVMVYVWKIFQNVRRDEEKNDEENEGMNE